jgi:mannitol-1-phosphate 5-dehydrogenase
MAFRFQNVPDDEESKELEKIMKDKSPKEVVQQVCGLESEHPLFERVEKIVKKVQADMKSP